MSFLFLLCFLFYKIREQVGRTGSAQQCGGCGRGRWLNQCIHMQVNAKMILKEVNKDVVQRMNSQPE
jgi:hypothetical protein